MKRDLNLTANYLAQEVTLTLPLHAVARIFADGPATPDLRTFADAPSMRLDALPAIGADWEGGKYAGLTLQDGLPSALVLLPGEMDPGTWSDAQVWADRQGSDEDPAREAHLPSRMDALALWQNRDKLGGFASDWYWTSEPRASDASYAWIQHFGHGHQNFNHTSFKYRARAVRRVPIR